MIALESDLTKLSAVRAWLEFKDSNTTYDAALQRLISACSLFMQRYMERNIYSTSYHQRYSGPGAAFMSVRHYPITHVTSVVVDGVTVPAANIAFEDRTIYLDGAYHFTRGRINVELVYTAGYEQIPVDLAQACIDAVALRWRERDRIGQSSKGLSGETTTFSLVDFPAQVRTLMDTYKNRVPV